MHNQPHSLVTKNKISNSLTIIPLGEVVSRESGGVIRNLIKIRKCTFNGANNYQSYTRFLMEKHIGRKLESKEIVHHKNGLSTDDRIENLEIVTIGKHMREHKKNKKLTKTHIQNIGKSLKGRKCPWSIETSFKYRKNKKYKEIYGEEKAKDIKQKISDSITLWHKNKLKGGKQNG